MKLLNPKHKQSESIQLLNLSALTFLFTLPRCQVIFQWKQRKEKLGNVWSTWRNFCVDLNLGNGKHLSVFLGVFARIVKVTHFSQVINFRERAHGKIHPRMVERIYVFFVSCLFLFFNTTAKIKSLLSLFFCSLSVFFVAICFSNGLRSNNNR